MKKAIQFMVAIMILGSLAACAHPVVVQQQEDPAVKKQRAINNVRANSSGAMNYLDREAANNRAD
ncbi:MAG: hypothetical protein J5706_01880 [Elusimicrobiales bacterium]|nr:hypothetical protein [Elusimicrobiales bacterium]